MAEDVARAVGAASPNPIIIAGKECRARALSIKELTEVERDCLSRYRRSFIQAFSENIDLLPEAEGKKLLREKYEEAARFDLSDLPLKYAYDPRRLVVNDKLTEWMKAHVEGFEVPTEDVEKRLSRMAALALESGQIDDDTYTSLVGQKPQKTAVSYVSWWVTGTFEGMVSMAWMAVKQNGVTREDLVNEIGNNPNLLVELSRDVESLTAPSVGNG